MVVSRNNEKKRIHKANHKLLGLEYVDDAICFDYLIKIGFLLQVISIQLLHSLFQLFEIPGFST